MIGLTILGSTGTIGVNTLDVVARHRDRYRIVALTAHRDLDRLASQCEAWHPLYAVMVDETQALALERRLAASAPGVRVLAGRDSLAAVASAKETDYVMAGIVGAAGLVPTLAAARAGKRVLLANKEALVMSGSIFMDAIRASGAELLPVDSEHNAIFQCLPPSFRAGLEGAGVRRILLTGSGGPLRET
ncbi:MAG: 1-deoxy-D-xylulose-5-phosphate reductoisomerase, partial [Rhodospirillales bacterium]|nr:1-deoxy-D-xylulose-5-phosphate reductoisomerase [Rhodospirillales bacterium]